MQDQFAIQPSRFGGKLQTPEFYSATNGFINTLRNVASLRTIADALNQAGFSTPSGMMWNKGRLANYLGSTAAAKYAVQTN